MLLGIKERLAIVQMLPENGSIVEMVDIIEIMKKVRIDQEEKIQIDYREEDGRISWNSNADEGKEVEFKYEEIAILKAAVKKLDEGKRVTPANLDICLKINSL